MKTNDFISLPKYPIEYLKLVFASISFETTILSTLTSQIILSKKSLYFSANW